MIRLLKNRTPSLGKLTFLISTLLTGAIFTTNTDAYAETRWLNPATDNSWRAGEAQITIQGDKVGAYSPGLQRSGVRLDGRWPNHNIVMDIVLAPLCNGTYGKANYKSSALQSLDINKQYLARDNNTFEDVVIANLNDVVHQCLNSSNTLTVPITADLTCDYLYLDDSVEYDIAEHHTLTLQVSIQCRNMDGIRAHTTVYEWKQQCPSGYVVQGTDQSEHMSTNGNQHRCIPQAYEPFPEPDPNGDKG